MTAPPQLSEVKVKVDGVTFDKPVCLVEFQGAKDFGTEADNISLEMSPETLNVAIESLYKV